MVQVHLRVLVQKNGNINNSCTDYVSKDEEGFYSINIPGEVDNKKITTLGNNLFNQILPVVIANLGLGLIMTGIDFYAHVGGLVSGYLLSMAVGVTLREANNDRVNGIIMSIMLFAFLIFMVFFYL